MTAAVEMLAEDSDWVAVDRLVTGRWDHRGAAPRPADQIAAAVHLQQAGAKAGQIAELVGTTERQVTRWRSLGLLSA